MKPVSQAENRLVDIKAAAAGLRRDLSHVPLYGIAFMTLAGSLFLPLVRSFQAHLSPWLSPVLFTAGLATAGCLAWARQGSQLAPQAGTIVLLVTSILCPLLCPPELGLPITAVALGFVILTGTLTSPRATTRWFWLAALAWTLMAVWSGVDHPIDLWAFPTLFFASTAYLANRVSQGLRDTQHEAIRALEQLTMTNSQLRQERETAHQANRAKSVFLANMSHELRTPLNAIIGYGELILEAPTNAPADDVERIVGSGRHLLTVVNDILDMSRIEAGRLDLHEEHVDLAAVMRDVHGIARSLAHPGVGLDWRSELIDDTSMRGDSTRIRQVLLNVIGNALKFTMTGTVTVRARLDGDVVFEVVDTGPGIDDDQLSRLFEPFSQGVSKGLKHEGTGLGLAITRSLVLAMAGTIELTSTVGVGTRVLIRLPRTPPN